MKINNFLELRDFQRIIIENESIELDQSLLQRVNESFSFLKEFSKNKDNTIIYGLSSIKNVGKEVSLIINEREKNGDFKNDECLKIIKEADVIITNPPFSSFNKLIDILIRENKDFILFGNKNAIINKSIFSYYQQTNE